MSLAAVGQFCATSAVSLNKKICQDLISQAARLGAKIVFLPEASDFISKNKEETLQLTTSLKDSEFLLGLQEVAKKETVWVSVGVHENAAIPSKVYNTHVVIDGNGELISTYRKIHLFNVDIKNGPRLMESDSTVQGETIVDPIETPVGKLGLETCYDTVFPTNIVALVKIFCR